MLSRGPGDEATYCHVQIWVVCVTDWLSHYTIISSIPIDPTLTQSNIFQVLQKEDDLQRLGLSLLQLPRPVVDRILSRSGNCDVMKKKKTMIKHYRRYHPLASWVHLGGRLYFREHHTSLDVVRQYIMQQRGDLKMIPYTSSNSPELYVRKGCCMLSPDMKLQLYK